MKLGSLFHFGKSGKLDFLEVKVASLFMFALLACKEKSGPQENSPSSSLVLVQQGEDSPGRSSQDRSPLHSACFEGHQEVVQMFLKQGADLQARDSTGQTPLHLACLQN